MELRYLEDFRLNNYLMPYLLLNGRSPEEGFEMSYTLYAGHAFYSTMEDITDLENQTSFVNNGKRSRVTIALWFLAMESFINCLSKISCKKEGKDFAKLKGTKLNVRLDYILSSYGMARSQFKQSGLIPRINEFLQFRNEIFHDRNTGEQKKFYKTDFSPLPYYSNQVDVLQAMLIFIEISMALRYCIRALDLMANIPIANDNVLIFDKLDNLYKSFLKPFFDRVLEKQNLRTKLNLEIENFFQPIPSSNNYFKTNEVLAIFRNEQTENFKHNLNPTVTKIGNELYNSVVNSYNRPIGHHDSMNFVIDWQSPI